MHRYTFALVLAGATLALAQQPAPVTLTVHPIKEGSVYWIEGGGGNSTVVIGDAGVLVVDAKTTADGGKNAGACRKAHDKDCHIRNKLSHFRNTPLKLRS